MHGLINGNAAFWVLVYAVCVGVAAWLIGAIVSAVMLRSVEEHIEQHRQSNPIPEEATDNDSPPDSATMTAG